MKLEPLTLMEKRVSLSKDESDSSFFTELMLEGEFILKIITCVIVSSLKDDSERTKYHYEYKMVRANGLGDWSSIIDEISINHSHLLCRDFALNELNQLNRKCTSDDWQYAAILNLSKVAQALQIDLGYVKLPIKVNLKKWFTDFVRIRNKTKGHGAHTSSTHARCIENLELSIKLIKDNFHSFINRSWAYLYPNYSGKYRVSCMTSKVSPFDNLKYSTEFKNKFKEGIYIFIDEPIMVSLFFSNPELDDFFVSNGDFRASNFEIISYISGVREKYSGSNYLLPVTELPKSETEGLGKLIMEGNSFWNVPPTPEIYINREKIEIELKEVLKDSNRFPVITLRGKGGIGKTTTTLTCLHEIVKNKDYDVILWFSSRDIDLMMEGAKAVKAKVFNIQDIANEFCRLLEYNIKSQSDRIEVLQKNLEECEFGRCLFVFDNFETIDNPLEIYNWLYTYIRHPNKILITSRESRDFKADYPIEIGRMEYNESSALVEAYSKVLNVNHILTKKYIDKLIEESNSHPYIMKILLGEVAKSKKLNKIERIVAGRDDILTALFRRTYDSLSPASIRVFLTLCSWRSAIPQIAIEAVLLRPENEERINVEEAIEELRKSSFIDVFKSDEDDTTFISVPLAAAIFGKTELDIYADKLAIEDDKKILQLFGASQESDIKQGFKPRVFRVFKELYKALEKHKGDKLELLEKYLPIVESLCSSYPQAWLMLSDLYDELGFVEKEIDASLKFIKSNPSNTEKRQSWRKLVQLYKKQGDWKKESHALSEICIIPDTQITEISNIANRINLQIKNFSNVDLDHKELIVRKVTEILESRIYESSDATDYSRLAWLFLNQREKNRDKALKYAKSGVEKNPSNHYCVQLVRRLEEVKL